MFERRIENLKNSGHIIMKIKTNEYCIFDKSKHKNKIVGLYTEGIAMCSMFAISINDDEIVFFSHITEESNISQIIKEKIIPSLLKIKIINMNIIYSKSVGPLENKKKDNNIKEIIYTIDKIFTSTKIIKEHNFIISCLKLIKTIENDLLFKSIINAEYTFLTKSSKRNIKVKDLIDKNILIFKESVFMEQNTAFWFKLIEMENFAKNMNLLLL